MQREIQISCRWWLVWDPSRVECVADRKIFNLAKKTHWPALPSWESKDYWNRHPATSPRTSITSMQYTYNDDFSSSRLIPQIKVGCFRVIRRVERECINSNRWHLFIKHTTGEARDKSWQKNLATTIEDFFRLWQCFQRILWNYFYPIHTPLGTA